MAAKSGIQPGSPPPRRSMSPDQPNPAEPITESPSTTMGRIGWSLRTLLLCKYNLCLVKLFNQILYKFLIRNCNASNYYTTTTLKKKSI